MLLTHIVIALATIAFSTFMLFTPSAQKIRITYIMTMATLISAGALVIVNHASLTHTCLTGLAYLGLISVNVFLTKKKLAKESAE